MGGRRALLRRRHPPARGGDLRRGGRQRSLRLRPGEPGRARRRAAPRPAASPRHGPPRWRRPRSSTRPSWWSDDLVLLSAGDRVAADLRVVEAHALAVDTSLLTGESVPVPVSEDDLLFAGTFVIEGEGRALVDATGMAHPAGRHRPARPRAVTGPAARWPGRCDRVVRTVACIAVGVGVAFFAVSLAIGSPASDGFLFAIGVTVALVPEGLLPTVTLSLAMGAQRMAGRHALVRRLESVETLGSTTFICTDKTGTLTRNEMAVVEVWTPAGTARHPRRPATTRPAVDGSSRGRAPRRCSSSASPRRVLDRPGRASATAAGSPRAIPMEAAIDTLARRLGIDGDGDRATHPCCAATRSTPAAAGCRVVAGDRLVREGRPGRVLARCDAPGPRAQRGARRDGRPGACGSSPSRRARRPDRCPTATTPTPPRTTSSCWASSASRTRPGRARPRPSPPAGGPASASPWSPATIRPPPGPSPARSACSTPTASSSRGRTSPPTSRSSARSSTTTASCSPGSARGQAADRPGPAGTRPRRGHDRRRRQRRPGAPGRRHRHRHGAVAAPTSPAKPPTSCCSTTTSPRSSPPSSKDAATFANVHRFLTYHLTDNVAELTPFVVWALSGGRFPLALGVLQILCLDIGTDLLPALALGAEPPNQRMLARPPLGRHLIDGGAAPPGLRRARPDRGRHGDDRVPRRAARRRLAARRAASRPATPWPPRRAPRSPRSSSARRPTRSPAAAPPGGPAPGWTGNRLLLAPSAPSSALAGLFLLVPPLADVLDQAPRRWPAGRSPPSPRRPCSPPTPRTSDSAVDRATGTPTCTPLPHA